MDSRCWVHSLYSYRNVLQIHQSLLISLCSLPLILLLEIGTSRSLYGEDLRIPEDHSYLEIAWERIALYSELKGSFCDNDFITLNFWDMKNCVPYLSQANSLRFHIYVQIFCFRICIQLLKFLQSAKLSVQTCNIFVIFAHLWFQSALNSNICFLTYTDSSPNIEKNYFITIDCIYIFSGKTVVELSDFI